MVKARAEFEKAIGEIDKNTKNLSKKADKVIQKPTSEKDIVREAKNPVNYEKHMGLSREQAIERNNQINKENKLKTNADIELQINIKNVESLKKEVSDLENKLAKERMLVDAKIKDLKGKEIPDDLMKNLKILATELNNIQPVLGKAVQDYKLASSKQAEVYKESLARKNKESADLLKTFYGNLIYANQPIIDKLNEKIDAATDEATKKELEKDRETEQKKQNKLKADRDKAISDIVNKYTSSKIIAIDTDHDKLPDKDAKFHDPKLLVKKYTESNLNYIRDMEKGLYKPNENYPADPVNGEQNIRNTAPEFEIKEIPDNSGRQQLLLKDNKGNDIGVINLGTEKADQKGDYGEKVIVTSDRIEDLKAGKWDPELGKVVYTQSGANTCQSYTLLAQMIQEGVKFRDNTEDGRKLIHELTRLQLQIGETGNMSTATLKAYNNILAKYGLKANDFTEKKGFETIEQRHNAIKEQLRKGKIVNSGMYLDAPEFSKGEDYKLNDKGEKLKKFDKGHRVNIVGYDDVRKEWIVNDSNKKEELTRYPYGDFELGNRWSTVLEKK